MEQDLNAGKLLFVCHGKDCRKQGAKDLCKQLKQEIKKNKKLRKVQVVKSKCLDRCKFAPSVVYGYQWYGKVKSKDLTEILSENK